MGPEYSTAPIIWGTPKGALILTTAHIPSALLLLQVMPLLLTIDDDVGDTSGEEDAKHDTHLVNSH